MKNLIKKSLDCFWSLHRKYIKINLNLKDIHKGETCYIFGNGGSIKYYDLSIFNDHISIGLTHIPIHKQFRQLDMRYIIFAGPYLAYPIAKLYMGSYGDDNSRFIINYYFRNLWSNIKKNNDNVIFIESLTNLYGMGRTNNTRYYFNDHSEAALKGDLAGVFNDTNGSLNVSLNLAKYLGFTKTILVGCDYLASPAMVGHFYSNNDPKFVETKLEDYIKGIIKSAEGIKVTLLVPEKCHSTDFDCITYKELFGHTEKLKKNYEIIGNDNLENLRFLNKKQQIFL